MKIAYTSEYERKSDGVFNRVYNESEWMKKQGHEVKIFSSEKYKPWFRISGNASFWAGKQFKKDMIAFSPDIIITNTYRHPETITCQKLAKKMNIPCVLITHGSYESPRGSLLNAAAWLYDKTHDINNFDSVFRIADWELPFLKQIKKPCYLIPNAIPDEIFDGYYSTIRKPFSYNLLFLGRIVPVKDIPTLLHALANPLAKEYILTLAGPFEKEYRDFLVHGMETLGIQDRTCFVGEVNSIEYKKDIINAHDIFVLPSLREGLPTALIEAMAMGKICIASRTKGACELIQDGVNGFLFDIGNSEQLADIFNKISKMDISERARMEDTARMSVYPNSASSIYPKTEMIYRGLIENKSI